MGVMDRQQCSGPEVRRLFGLRTPLSTSKALWGLQYIFLVWDTYVLIFTILEIEILIHLEIIIHPLQVNISSIFFQ